MPSSRQRDTASPRRSCTDAWARGAPRARGAAGRSERGVERDLAVHADLVGRDAPLEEVRDLLHVLEIHEARAGSSCRSASARPSVVEPLVGAELEVLAHVRRPTARRRRRRGGPRRTASRSRWPRRSSAATDSRRARRRRAPAPRARTVSHHLERERHVRALVAEHPVGPRRRGRAGARASGGSRRRRTRRRRRAPRCRRRSR